MNRNVVLVPCSWISDAKVKFYFQKFSGHVSLEQNFGVSSCVCMYSYGIYVQEDGVGPKLSDQESDKNGMDTDSSTPAMYSDKEKLKSKNIKTRIEKKKHRRESCAIAESIRLLAEVVVRSEQARMDTMRELERMRAESEAKRGEMDLKRTEIIANTQLEIAKLFAAGTGNGNGKGVDSSLRIGRS